MISQTGPFVMCLILMIFSLSASAPSTLLLQLNVKHQGFLYRSLQKQVCLGNRFLVCNRDCFCHGLAIVLVLYLSESTLIMLIQNILLTFLMLLLRLSQTTRDILWLEYGRSRWPNRRNRDQRCQFIFLVVEIVSTTSIIDCKLQRRIAHICNLTIN